MRGLAGFAGVCAIAVVVGACGTTGVDPSSAAVTSSPTTVGLTTSPTALATTAAAEPTEAASPPAASGVRLVVDQAATKASYHAHEQLVGRTLPSEAVGSSSAVSGAIVLGTDGAIVADQSQIAVDVSKLASDESRRDNFIKGSTLQTSRYPMAVFVPRQALGLPSPLPTSGSATFQLSGDLTVHGVTKPVTWDINAQFDPASVTGDATTQVNISDFGMNPPKAGPVLSIEDGLTLELAFTASRGV